MSPSASPAPPEAVRVAVALGSNLGDRQARLEQGVRALSGCLEAVCVSSIYETEPAHVPDQPDFLNACCTGLTRLTARQLLSQLLDAERAAGRVRTGRRFAPRSLDLDLLLYGGRVIESPHLSVPHPRMRERAFVLVPLAEIAADWVVPASGGSPERTVRELLQPLDRTTVRLVSAFGESADAP